MTEPRVEDLIDYAALLEEVTVKPDSHEVPYDPDVLDRLVADGELAQRYLEMMRDADGCGRRREQLVERLAAVARKILPLKEKLCVLALLNCQGSLREVGRQLGIPKDSVRRALERATVKLQAVLSPDASPLPEAEDGGRLHYFVITGDAAAERLQGFLEDHEVKGLSHALDEDGVLTVCVLV